MIGKINSFYEKTKKKDGSKYLNVVVEVEGRLFTYICTDVKTMEAIEKSLNMNFEFSTFKYGTGTFMVLPKDQKEQPKEQPKELPKEEKQAPEVKPEIKQPLKKAGEFRESRNESFACAYAKDIAVAYINMGMLKQTVDTDAILMHYIDFFLKKLNGGA